MLRHRPLVAIALTNNTPPSICIPAVDIYVQISVHRHTIDDRTWVDIVACGPNLPDVVCVSLVGEAELDEATVCCFLERAEQDTAKPSVTEASSNVGIEQDKGAE